MQPKRRGRPPKKLTFNEAVDKMVAEDNKVNWEKLAKKQETELKLARQENEKLHGWCLEWREKFDKLEADHKKEIDQLNTESNNLFIRCHKLKGIIEYLEDKLENFAIRSR
jgi:hypothetical protein